MSAAYQHYIMDSVSTAASYGDGPKLPTDDCEYPELPPPTFPPALDFHPKNYMCSFRQADILEKALIQHSPSKTSFQSDTSTLRSTSSWTEIPLSKSSPEPFVLPPKRYIRLLRCLRYTLFTVYRRIFSLIFTINIVGILLLLRNRNTQDIQLDSLAVWASTNLLVSILIRQDYIVNIMFRTAWIVPWSVPLRIRRVIARVYTYGGIHTGAAVAGTMWFITFTILVTIRFIQERSYTLPILILTWVILTLLLTICLLAFPTLRSRHHNIFEVTHRLLGWTTIALFWTQFILLIRHNSSHSGASFSTLLVHSPTFYNLTLMTCMIAYPWLRLRKWSFYPEILSEHAIRLHFTQPVHKFSCLSISSSPFTEWHPFATFPTTTVSSPLQSSSTSKQQQPAGASLVVSAAGDWTTALITRTSTSISISSTPSKPPTPLKFFVKGSPRAGVLSLSTLFPRIILLTTGSGIGPCLSSLLDRPAGQFIRLIWSTRSPLLTYGREILDQVEAQDPEAVIMDTDTMGRPDLVRVAMRVFREVNAEAVFVLSNEKVTRKVVYGLESRGVPAFGPIWDS